MPDARSTPSPQADMVSGRVAVLLPLPLSGPYDYLAREEMRVAPGAIVRVPLGRRMLTGVVWGEGDVRVDTARLRPIEQVLDSPPLPEVARRFIDWVADYTITPPGAVLRMTLASPGALEP